MAWKDKRADYRRSCARAGYWGWELQSGANQSLEDEFQSNLSDTRATGMPDALAEIARFDDSSEGIERAA